MNVCMTTCIKYLYIYPPIYSLMICQHVQKNETIKVDKLGKANQIEDTKIFYLRIILQGLKWEPVGLMCATSRTSSSERLGRWGGGGGGRS